MGSKHTLPPHTYFQGVMTQPRGSTLLHQALLHPTLIVCDTCDAPVTLTFDLLTLKVVSQSDVTCVYLCANFSLRRPASLFST